MSGGVDGGGVPSGALAATQDNSTLFSIIETLSTGTADVQWHMHRTTHNRADTACPDCEQPGVRMVDNHPMLTVFNKPNDFFTRELLVESVQQHVDLVGEGWMTVVWVAGRPIELWPVRPDRMSPVRDPDNYLNGYVYRSPDGQLIPLRRDEILFIRVPNPLDPYRGMGAVQTLVNQLWGSRYAAEWNRRFFENSAQPGGLVEMPVNLSDDEWQQFQDRWAESHRGVNNAHTVGMLEYGAKWVDLKYTQKDMEFVELRRVTREEIREAFGIHGHILGLTEDINRANADAGDATYAKRKIVPRANRWKSCLQNQFLPMFGAAGLTKGYELTYTSPVPADREADNAERESKARTFQVLVNAHCTPEYAASFAGMPAPEMAEAPTSAPGQAGLEDDDLGQPNDDPGGDDRTGGGQDGAAMDTLRTWAPVKLAGRALPGMLNSIHDRLADQLPRARGEAGHGS
jgi:HK97 family phage portal protein